jgi:hypothetical protein
VITQAEQDRRVRHVIQKAPWIRADEVARVLAWDVASVSASLRRLKSANALKSRGRTRATAYAIA